VAQRVVDHHEAVGFAARHAEFVFVDPLEGETLVELEGPFEVAAQFGPAYREQSHLDAPAGFDAGNQPGKPSPAALEHEKTLGMQDGIELHAERGVDLGDVPVDGGSQ
jgi:hypothetical protein